MKYSEFLKSLLPELNKSFNNNELAYLSLTSKIENPIRDKIAFNLHKEFSDDKIICREWTNNENNKNKADIAILNSNKQLECIIEFKAHSSMKNISQWSKHLVNDFQKNSIYNNCEFIFIMLANLIDELPNEKFNTAVKYYKNLNSAMENNYNQEKMKNQWLKSVNKRISCITNYYVLKCGLYEQKEVKLLIFMHENIKLNGKNC